MDIWSWTDFASAAAAALIFHNRAVVPNRLDFSAFSGHDAYKSLGRKYSKITECFAIDTVRKGRAER